MAERHWVNGGVNLLWSTTGNWSLTEGGAGGQAVPTAAEDVFFDAGSPSCTINTSTRYGMTLNTSAYTNTLTFNASLVLYGNVTIGANTQFAGATTNRLAARADGTWTTNGKTIPQGILINGWGTGTITLADDLTTSGDLLLDNTTSTTFAGNFHITAATCTISNSQTVTIVHDVTITGLLTIADANVLNGAFNWNVGGLTMTGSITGTSAIIMNGGTWSDTGNVGISLSFAGTCAVSSTVSFGASGKTLTYTSGTTTPAAGSTLTIPASCILNTDPISWVNVTISAAATVTINSLLTVTGTLTLPNAATTFAGTIGWITSTLANSTISAIRTYTFVSAKTYTVTSAMNAKGAFGSQLNFVASTPGTKAILTVGYGATQDVEFVYPTDIDSSLGQAIFSEKGVIVTSYNWSVSIANGNLIYTAGGESVTVAGITKDNAGTALGSCDVYLFRDNGTDTATYIAYVESNSVTGAYSFTVFPGSTYFVVAFKGGATPVMDVTDRTVTAV